MFSATTAAFATALLVAAAPDSATVTAGGWALSTLDETPAVVAGEPIDIGFTVLQHGVSPVDADIGEIGIVVTPLDPSNQAVSKEVDPKSGASNEAVSKSGVSKTDGSKDVVSTKGVSKSDTAKRAPGSDGTGGEVFFPASAGHGPGHFVATVLIGDAGTYEWSVRQGWFGEYPLGELDVVASMATTGWTGAIPIPIIVVIAGAVVGAAVLAVMAVRRRAESDGRRPATTQAAGVPDDDASVVRWSGS